MRKRENLEFAGSIAGIYGCFLTWGLLQERLATTKYGGEPFRFFIVLNSIQAAVAAFVAHCVILVSASKGTSLRSTRFGKIWFEVARLAAAISIASPFGYAAMRHLPFPAIILGKSCKVIPVLLVGALLYRKQYPATKYALAVMITAGVSLFTAASSHSNKEGESGAASNVLLGSGLLLFNLFLDGLINQWQENLIHRHLLGGAELMRLVNGASAILMTAYLAITRSELIGFAQFIARHGRALVDVLAFALAGSLGQLFIFHVLARWGSVVLVTITVTRKMLTMLMSILWYRHPINLLQVIGIVLVFAAIILESRRAPK